MHRIKKDGKRVFGAQGSSTIEGRKQLFDKLETASPHPFWLDTKFNVRERQKLQDSEANSSPKRF